MTATNQEAMHASICTLLGTTPGTWESDWHALWDEVAIATGPYNGRMLAWINGLLATSYDNITTAQNGLAVALGFTNWSNITSITDAVAAGYFLRSGALTVEQKNRINGLAIGLRTDLGLQSGTLATQWDALYLLGNETAAAALKNFIKDDHHCTAVASPTFAANTGYTFNGSSQYLRTDYIASTDAVALTGSNMIASVYERANVAADTDSIGVSTGTNSNILLRANSAANNMGLRLNSAFTNKANGNSSGLCSVTRSGSTFEYWRNGSSLGTATPGTTSTTNPNLEAYIAATNNAGTPAAFRASNVVFAAIGKSMTAAQHSATYTRILAYLTAIGGN